VPVTIFPMVAAAERADATVAATELIQSQIVLMRPSSFGGFPPAVRDRIINLYRAVTKSAEKWPEPKAN
jgi:hypothetical protein